MRDRLNPALVAVIFGLVLISVGCDKDVTNDAQYRFSSVVGTWKTKTPLMLKNDEGKLGVATGDDPVGKLMATLPAGIEIRVEHLIRCATDAGTNMRITGTITSGQYVGKNIWITTSLFAPNPYTDVGYDPQHLPNGWRFGWAVDPEKLEPASSRHSAVQKRDLSQPVQHFAHG